MWLLFYSKPSSEKLKNPFITNYNMIDNMNPDNFSGLVESISKVFWLGVFFFLGGYESRLMWQRYRWVKQKTMPNSSFFRYSQV